MWVAICESLKNDTIMMVPFFSAKKKKKKEKAVTDG